MGIFDRSFRALVIAPVAIAMALLIGAGSVAGVILFIVAGVALISGATGVCPTYTVLGISTRGSLHRVGHGIRHGHA
jgi:hypothetical protein